jgi:acetylornithine deacetylase/succinyl-diaminopimelate desuccinylase-like protein
MIEASRKRNVIPGTCTITVDCRLLPGQPREEVEALLRAGVPATGRSSGSRRVRRRHPLTDRDTPLERSRGLGRGDRARRPLAPIACGGFTDSHYVRSALGTTAYGFFPIRAMAPELVARLVHGATSGSRSTTSSSRSTSTVA